MLQMLRLKAGVLCDTCQHAWPKFLAIVEGEHEVRPTFASQGAMRAGLALDLPAQFAECGEDALGL